MADRVGEQFGKYKLTKLLGRGGFADVYLGQHVTLGTLAAIKILHTRLEPDDLASFLKEAQTIARLAEHPHILRVLDFADNGGLSYLVMDYAPNGTLRQRHPAGTRVPLETVLTYAQQVASAMQFAHEQQPPIVHRDIKQENMLLGRQDEIRLSDFGIAVTVTQYLNPHAPSGTAAYMAPELFNGEVHRASDQYALGVVVYEWLCGVRPFPGPGYLQYGYQHVNNLPPTLRDRAPDLPSAVEAVVFSALAKDPKLRFGSVREFAEALLASRASPPPAPLPQAGAPAVVPVSVPTAGSLPGWFGKRKAKLPSPSPSPIPPLQEPELYDLRTSDIKDELNFWKRMAGEVGGPVLEVGARTGRVTMELARTGLLVTALEPSRARLQYARVQAEQKLDQRTRLEWVESKLYDFSLGSRTFRLIVAPLGTLHELRNLEEIKQCLDCMVAHLEPEGRVVLAVQAPRPETLQVPRHHERVLHSPRTGQTINYYVTQETNHLWAKLKTTHEYEIMESHPPRLICHIVEGSYFNCRDLVDLLHDAGLETQKIFGSYAREPPNLKSEVFIFEARHIKRI